jgi:hypothetical protein
MKIWDQEVLEEKAAGEERNRWEFLFAFSRLFRKTDLV